jgi:hypothetical protein
VADVDVFLVLQTQKRRLKCDAIFYDEDSAATMTLVSMNNVHTYTLCTFLGLLCKTNP